LGIELRDRELFLRRQLDIENRLQHLHLLQNRIAMLGWNISDTAQLVKHLCLLGIESRDRNFSGDLRDDHNPIF
jgi:hypothetical protein